ncbi:MAG: serine/threonine protein phosphatase, partial [Chloroflexia bacterium]|nr:serine/threonine protein phosphatase [Chloroflexia bacterium]
DLFVMRTLADQIAIAIDSANIYRAQQEEAWTLNALLQVAENIGRANCVADLLATAVRLPPILLGAARCYLLRWEQEAFVVRSSYGLTSELRDALSGVLMTLTEATLLAHVYSLHTNDPMPMIRISGAEMRARAWPALAELVAGAGLVALPLTGRSGHLGALVLDFDEVIAEFDTRQINLCIGAARQVAAALESLQLAEEAEAATKLEQEIKVARELQTALLPSRSPQLEGWQIASAWRSARMVGGDFFDFWRLPARPQLSEGDEQAAPLGFVIADVSDKGVPAALFMALSRSLVRAAALDGASPSVALERANRWINRDSESGMFVTLFYGILQPETGQVRYSVAGHNPPLHYHARDATFTELRTPGIALGVLDEIQLNEAEVCLAPGDILLCYTDGATETIDEGKSEFGTDRLRDLIRLHHLEHAEVLVEAILQAVTTYGRGQPPYDDITLL